MGRANGADNGEQFKGVPGPGATGETLDRTGPGKENDVEDTTGKVDTGKTAESLGDAPEKVAELPTGGPPLQMAARSTDDIASEIAEHMGSIGIGKGQGPTYDMVKAGERNRAIQVARLQKSAADVSVGRGVPPPAPQREKNALAKAAVETTDDMVDRMFKSGTRTPVTEVGAGGSPLTRKVECDACGTSVPELFKGGVCPACGGETMRKAFVMPETSPTALRPLRVVDLHLPTGYKPE